MKLRTMRATRKAASEAALDPGADRPLLVLTGRPNVGKSTIFNRIVGERRAVVESTPGVTRDRLYAPAEWAGTSLVVTDTGGLGGADGDPFAPLVAAQTRAAIAEADVVLLVVDAGDGLLPVDRDIAAEVRRLRKPVILIANKADRRGAAVHEFYALGLGEPLPLSAVRGEGLGDILDRAVALLRQQPRADALGQGNAPTRVVFVGRPNVGKSSLVNRLLGRERLIVSDIAGTTRDAVDVSWQVGDQSFLLVDTPGLRRPARVARQGIERWSAARTTSAVARAEVAVIVLDAAEPCTDQDKRIAGNVADRRRAAIVVLNKVDLIPGPALADVLMRVRSEMPFLAYAPVLASSTVTGQGLADLPATMGRVGRAYRRRLATAPLNQCIRAAVALHPPASFEGRAARIYYATQIRTAPPTIALVTNHRGAIAPTYVRYLENRVREQFELPGAPVRFVFRERAHRRLILGSPERRHA